MQFFSIKLKICCRLEKERNDKDAELNSLKMKMTNINNQKENKDGIIKSLEVEVNMFNSKTFFIDGNLEVVTRHISLIFYTSLLTS